MDEVTAIIKTFDRPRCLQALMRSLRARYAGLPTIIVDDSQAPYAVSYRDACTRIVVLPFDSGISAGRNAGLAACRSKYFVLFDDDFVVDERTDIAALVEKLEYFDLDIVAGEVMERSAPSQFNRPLGYNANFDIREEEFGTIVSVSKARIELPVTHCDLVANFFVARTGVVRDRLGGWDSALKVAEHTEFFYRAKKAGLRVGLAPTVSINHVRQALEGCYGRYRKRGNTPKFHDFWLRKHNVVRLRWYDGSESIRGRGEGGQSTFVRRKARGGRGALFGRSRDAPINGEGTSVRIRRRVRGNSTADSLRAAGTDLSPSDHESARAHARYIANLQLLNDLLQPTELSNAYCVFCGLLLGWIREGRPLGHDSGDADFLVLQRDWWRLMRSLPQLERAGFQRGSLWVANDGSIAEITLKKDRAKFEFFRGEHNGQMYRHYAFSGNEQIAYQYPAFDFAKHEFLGRVWNRPANAEQHLAYYYGDWKTPKPKFNYARDIRAIVGREPWHGQSLNRWG